MATILIVDDRVINRDFLSTLLGYAGYRVVQAANGAEALDEARREVPDLVISDVLMPILDGVELVHRMRADPALEAVPVIFYTATYRLSEARLLAQSCGVSRVIAKPAEPQTILDAVAVELGVASTFEPPLSVAPGHLGLAGAEIPPSLRELTELQGRLQKALGDRAAATAVEAVSFRLAALVELGLLLPSERDAGALLKLFVRAAQDIMRCRYAVVGVEGLGDGVWRFAVQGMDADLEAQVLAALDPLAGALGEVKADGQAVRRSDLPPDPTLLGLPAAHPPFRSFLAVPVVASRRPYGWLYLADKRSAEEFRDDDVQFAMTLASQLAPIWASLVLIEQAQRQAAALAESEERYRLLWETTTDTVILFDDHHRIQYVNPAVEPTFGYRPEELIGQELGVLQPSGAAAQTASLLERHLATGEKALNWRGFESEGRHRDGRVVPVEVALSHIILDHRALFAAFIRDISERKQHEGRIARLTRIHSVLSGINAAIVRLRDRQSLFEEACRIAVKEGQLKLAWIGLIDPHTREGEVVAWSGDQPGFSEKQLRLTLREDIPEGQRPACRAAREGRAVVCNDVAAEVALTSQREDLLKRGYRALTAFPLLVDGRAVGVLVLYADQVGFFDDEEIRLLGELAGDLSFALQFLAKEEKLNYLSYYDPLTGLPNATLFLDRLGQYLATPKSEDHLVAVILIDLDRFTEINDTLGRHVGDALLRAVGEALGSSLWEPYTLARIGEDTFAVAVPGLRHDTDAAPILSKRIFAALEQPFSLAGQELRISAKAGIALHPHDGDTAETLFKNAEVSLKQAQVAGERFVFYEREITARATERISLEVKLRRAAAHEEFLFHYQPKLDARTGRLVGLEALMRWQDPERGLISPVAFIPMLEETGLIVEVGQWGIGKALADFRGWQGEGLEPPPVAVNVSSLQLQRPDFLARLEKTIADSGVTAEALELEVTESLVMGDFEHASETLRRIRAMGVSIALDDFGTGYSSLRYLARLPVDTLKIHRSFVVAMVNDPDSMAIVQTVISLSHALGLAVVGEGVDSSEQAKLLRLMRCDVLQGFLFSRPVAPELMPHLLARHRELGHFELSPEWTALGGPSPFPPRP